jgi:hypothetical protein
MGWKGSPGTNTKYEHSLISVVKSFIILGPGIQKYLASLGLMVTYSGSSLPVVPEDSLDLVDLIHLLDPVNPVDPIDSFNPVNPVHPMDSFNPVGLCSML